MKFVAIACSALLVALSTHAAQPPCSASAYDDWAFWVGEWEVKSIDGQPQGTNIVSREEGNCLIVERWKSVQGGTGQSYNYFNPGDDQWHQSWVSSGAIIDYSGNLNDAGAMHLEGTITYQASGDQAKFSGTWTPREDGTVLQELKQWDDESAAWQDWFTGIYHPKR